MCGIMVWQGGSNERIDRSTLRNWISILTDGSGFGLERFAAGYRVYMPRFGTRLSDGLT